MNDRIDDVIAARLGAAANLADDSDWLDVRRRARNLEARRTLRPRLRLAAAAAVLAGGVTVLLGVLPAGDEPTRPVLGLDAVAAIAAGARSTVPAPGEYVYDEQRYEHHGTACTVEWWIAADRSGRVHQRGQTCQLPSDPAAGGRLRPIKSGPWPSYGLRVEPLSGWPSGDGLDIRFGPGEALEVYDAINPSGVNAWLDGLPTDRQALERALHRRILELKDSGGYVSTVALVDVISQLLANPLTSPKLRSALYEIAGALNGVEIKERVTDPAGRVGTAITAGGYDRGVELIFDPATSAILARGQISRGKELFHVYLERQTVESLHDRP
jgi:hypothetical protein